MSEFTPDDWLWLAGFAAACILFVWLVVAFDNWKQRKIDRWVEARSPSARCADCGKVEFQLVMLPDGNGRWVCYGCNDGRVIRARGREFDAAEAGEAMDTFREPATVVCSVCGMKVHTIVSAQFRGTHTCYACTAGD